MLLLLSYLSLNFCTEKNWYFFEKTLSKVKYVTTILIPNSLSFLL